VNFINLLSVWFPNATRPDWVVNSFPIIRVIIMVLLLVIAAALVVCVLAAPTKASGIGAISGQSTDTYYYKHKGRSLEGILKRLVIILSITAFVLTVFYFVSIQIVAIDWTPPPPAAGGGEGAISRLAGMLR